MKLSRTNTLLLVAIIVINGYVVLLPFLPNLLFWSQYNPAHVWQLQQTIRAPSEDRPAENRLTVPSMVLDQPVFEGQTAATLRQGLWHRPLSSTPDKGGNTVLVGHRFTYTDPRGPLYHLDKVRLGDEIGLTWNGKKYLYKTTEIKRVEASETSVEAPTAEPQLTLYTCTPLWLPKDRLVVIAKLEDSL